MHSDDPILQFRQACGATEPLTFRVEDARTGGVVCEVRDEPFLLIGRDPRADLCLEAPEVSRRHAYLQVIGGRPFCFDLSSRTGIRWERGTAPFGWLGGEEAIGFGPFTMRLLSDTPEVASAVPDPLAPMPAGQDGLPDLILEGAGRAASVLWRMNRLLAFMGQAAECRVRLHGSMSRFRCAFVRTPAGTWLVDLLGRPDVLVNEAQARCVLLREGDEVRVGSLSLRVRYDVRPGPRPALTLDRLGPDRRPETAAGTEWIAAGDSTLPVVLAAPVPDLQALLRHAPSPLAPADLPPAPPEVAAWLLPLAGQFARMQQEMFDQFTQTLLMMGQMFGQLHRDQMAEVRGELERLQQVTGDLRLLQAELGQLQGGAANGVLPPRPNGTPSTAGAVPEAAAPAPKAGGDAPPSPTSPPPPGVDRAEGLSDQDIHARLCRRIAELQQERETRWQKLLNALFGRREADPSRRPSG